MTTVAGTTVAGTTVAGTVAAGTVAVDDRCKGCGACLATCPDAALLPARGHPRVLEERCSGCGACIEVCPAGAISESGGPDNRAGGRLW